MLRDKHAHSDKKAGDRGPDLRDDGLYDAFAPIYDKWRTWGR